MLNHRIRDLFWLLVFEIHLASYLLHNTRAKDLNNTSETMKVLFIFRNKNKVSFVFRKSRSEDVNKAKFGSFCVAILSLLFSPYFFPVLQCNNVAYLFFRGHGNESCILIGC